ncbi:hypothetical protein [Methylobacterium thuringiense]|uniref:Uncharacterized protein n=1 Tax=Methylobacterium thuringiense TaxID=1003091 RepID=A0ABQ4TNW1_9HYPH|nr:hypothetical protein [Methylobacterium thuringiense]GJE56681.1 hypothetical protein EKPJFOCH_3189 [Methylobacterium thuringiense]
MRLIGRLLLGSLGLVLAIPCGAIVLGVGVLIDPASRHAVARLGLEGLIDLASGLSPDVMLMAFAALSQTLLVLLALPPSLVALIGEAIGLRAAAWYGGASGALTALLPWLTRSGSPRAGGQATLAVEGRAVALYFLTGAASGLVYWLVAGLSAGRSEDGRSTKVR